ncbi:MAG: ral stress protein [Verrucomicrobiota bacterium]|jgi:RNA polymerase-binding transcription factor DksA
MPKSQPKKPAAKKPKASPAKGSKPAAVKAAKKPVAKAAKKPAAKADSKTKAKPVPSPKAPVKKNNEVKKKEGKAKKPETKSTKPVKSDAKKASKPAAAATPEIEATRPKVKGGKITPFMKAQREKLQLLRDTILDSMAGVAKDTLRSRPEGSEASAFGMHQADAGSDAYDKDFALSLLSQEQDALYEIEEAMKRVDNGTYGICEMSGKPIPVPRLEALPFARYTVECQAELERTKKHQRSRVPVTSLFGLTDSDDEESEGEESEESPQKPQNEE